MCRWLLLLITLSYAQCNGIEYNGDDPKVDAGYIWYNGVEWVDEEP